MTKALTEMTTAELIERYNDADPPKRLTSWKKSKEELVRLSYGRTQTSTIGDEFAHPRRKAPAACLADLQTESLDGAADLVLKVDVEGLAL